MSSSVLYEMVKNPYISPCILDEARQTCKMHPTNLVGQQDSKMALPPLHAAAHSHHHDGLLEDDSGILENVAAVFVLYVIVGDECHECLRIDQCLGHLIHRLAVRVLIEPTD